MQTLSATDAISPAVHRTQALLQPFLLGRWLKLGLVAILAEMSSQVLFPPGMSFQKRSFAFAGGMPAAIPAAGMTAIIVAAVLVMFVLSLVLLYFGSRLQLVLMDMVATGTTAVTPAWRRSRSGTWRWIGLKLLCFLGIVAVLGVPLLLLMMGLGNAMHGDQASRGGLPLAGWFVFVFMAALLFVAVAGCALWFLRDIALPFLLFENARMRDAMRRAIAVVRREPGGVLLYFLMKLVLMLVLGFASEFCFVLAILALGIPASAMGLGMWFMLHRAGPAGIAAMIASFVALGLAFLAGVFCVAICAAAAALIFSQSYALYFMGGRYSTLGNLLEPPPPPVASPAPAWNPS